MIVPFEPKKKEEPPHGFRLLKCKKGATEWFQIEERIDGEWNLREQVAANLEAEARDRFNFLVAPLEIEVLEEK